jgi:hypothetical protein
MPKMSPFRAKIVAFRVKMSRCLYIQIVVTFRDDGCATTLGE